MSTPRTDSSSPPRYEAGDDSRSYTNKSDTLPSSAFEPRYVYYRVYSWDGMVHCKKKYGPSSCIGRIKATSVLPPYTVASLKRALVGIWANTDTCLIEKAGVGVGCTSALVQAEGLPDLCGTFTNLFQTRDARTAMVGSARVDILTGDLGATAHIAVAVVFLTTPKERLSVASDDGTDDEVGDGLPPLYYRLYNRGGEERSMRHFDASEPALGRLKRESIAPPRNALSVKRRIARVEGKPIYQLADLFADTTANNPSPSGALVENISGSTMTNPILIVQPERRAGLYNRPVLVVALRTQGDPYHGYGRWLSPSVGDTLYTDGVARYESSAYGGDRMWYVYTAVDESGKTGYSAHSQRHRARGDATFNDVPELCMV
ncbi:hypothetical protein C8J57DRAFT_1623689 [Mycena rebaudengoi]|nr:hypothetical protein C8J57DRAFT_1623689 [Mycena rebaudengoi]